MKFLLGGKLVWLILLIIQVTEGQWTLHGSSPIAVEGTDFVLTCTVPPDDTEPQILAWSRIQGGNSQYQFIITSTCTADGTPYWSTFTCNKTIFSLTIPGVNIDTDNDNNVGWKCQDAAGGGGSNVLIMTVLDPVTYILMNATNPLTFDESNTVSILCVTSPCRPAARVLWYRDLDNITTHVNTKVEKHTGDKYVTVSYLTIMGNRDDNGRTIQCKAQNGPANGVANSTIMDIWYAPRSSNTPEISGYVNGTTLVESSTTKHRLFCKLGDCNPLCTLIWDCQGLTGSDRNTQKESVSVIYIPIQRKYNGKTCKCTARHISVTYTNSTAVVFTIYSPPVIKRIGYKILAELHSIVEITIPFYSNPEYTSVSWSRNHKNDSLYLKGDRIIENVADANISLLFNNRYFMFKGKNATFIIQNITKTEFTNYTLRVENAIGENEYTVAVEYIGPPDPPIGIAAVCTCIHTAEVLWISKYNGGTDQNFRISVKTFNDATYTKGNKITDPGENEIVRGAVTGLKDDTRYLFTVYAENKYGKSMIPVNLECVTPVKVNCQAETNTASIVLIILSMVLITGFVIGISIRWLLMRRRKTLNNQHERSMQNDFKAQTEMDAVYGYQELGEREQPVETLYQELHKSRRENAPNLEINVYQELGKRETGTDNQYQHLETMNPGTEQDCKKGNVYDVLGQQNPPNVYDEIKSNAK